MNPQQNVVEFIYYALIVAGVIIIGIAQIMSSLVGSLVGYSFIITGLFFSTGYLLFQLSGNYGILSLLSIMGPFLVILGVIGYYISILTQYKQRITDGNIAGGYYSFSNIFLILVLLECFVFYWSLRDKQFEETHTINKVNSMLLYLLGLFGALSAITTHIILAYYSTDG